MPTPTEMSIGYMDISKAERNANGKMIIERIAEKRKLEIKYAYISAADLSLVLSTIAPTSYSVTYLNALTNNFQTGSFYCGDRTVAWLDYIDGVPRYKDFAFNLIEL